MKRTPSEEFGSRLKRARLAAGLSQAQLAEKVGISVRLVRYYEAGAKAPLLDRLSDVARATGRDVGWFFEAAAVRMVPLYHEVPAGPSKAAFQEMERMIPVPPHWARGRAEVFCLKVRGDSMAPTLLDGDVIAVRRQPEAEERAIVVARVEGLAEEGEYVVKRLARRGGKWILRSDNRAYGDVDCEAVEGVVVGLIRDVAAG